MYLPSVDFSAFHRINPRWIYAVMSEYIGKPFNIFLQGIVCACEKVPKVMRKDLVFWYARAFAKSFHIRPYIAPVKRLAIFAYEYGTFWYFLLAIYSFSILQSCFGRITILIFPLQLIVAEPSLTDSTVIALSSETICQGCCADF